MYTPNYSISTLSDICETLLVTFDFQGGNVFILHAMINLRYMYKLKVKVISFIFFLYIHCGYGCIVCCDSLLLFCAFSRGFSFIPRLICIWHVPDHVLLDHTVYYVYVDFLFVFINSLDEVYSKFHETFMSCVNVALEINVTIPAHKVTRVPW